MNFDFSEKEREKKSALSGWLGKEFPEPFPPLDRNRLEEWTKDFLHKAASLDFLLTTGNDPALCRETPYSEMLLSVLLGEELARFTPSLALSLETSCRLFGWLLARYGDEDQRRRYLLPLQQGTLLGTVALAESSANFPDTGVRTEGRKKDGVFLLRGKKTLVVNAPLADCLAVSGVTDEGRAFFLLPRRSPGLAYEGPLDTLGFQHLFLAHLSLDDCQVAATDVIGPFADDQPFHELSLRQQLILACVSLGILEKALFGAQKRAGEKRENGKPLRAQQEIGFKLAEMFTLYQTAQWLLYRAAWMLENTIPEAEITVQAAKVFITEAAEEVARSAMQIAAGEGFLSGNELEACFRDARFGPVSGETSEVLRMRIAEACLAKYQTR